MLSSTAALALVVVSLHCSRILLMCALSSFPISPFYFLLLSSALIETSQVEQQQSVDTLALFLILVRMLCGLYIQNDVGYRFVTDNPHYVEECSLHSQPLHGFHHDGKFFLSRPFLDLLRHNTIFEFIYVTLHLLNLP